LNLIEKDDILFKYSREEILDARIHALVSLKSSHDNEKLLEIFPNLITCYKI